MSSGDPSDCCESDWSPGSCDFARFGFRWKQDEQYEPIWMALGIEAIVAQDEWFTPEFVKLQLNRWDRRGHQIRN